MSDHRSASMMAVRVIALSALTSCAIALIAPAYAEYPERAVRVIVPQSPGGGTDTVTRVITQKLGEVFGQPFVVDDRPGASGSIAAELAMRANPDGYTLLTVTPTHVINGSLHKDLRFDPVRDFSAVGVITNAQYFLSVSNNLGVSTVSELLALAKSRSQPLSYASTGSGSANHLSGELFKSMAHVNLVHVPYKGGAPALNAVIAGEVPISFTSSAALPHARAGRLKTIAVTGPKRTPTAPDIPTISESGLPGYEVVGWYGLVAPAKTPKAIVERLNTTINRVLPELRERYFNLGMDLGGGSAAEFGAFLRKERDRWAQVVKISGAKAD